ncbi:MAG: SDR family NAD(P)-dependent oxidoreductase [Pseudobdellovibrionaceae bacterium]
MELADQTNQLPAVAFLGASRGLGHQVLLSWQKSFPGTKNIRVARQFKKMETSIFESRENVEVLNWEVDFSKQEQWAGFLEKLISHKVQKIFYFAGGGPYGGYATKQTSVPSDKWPSQSWSHHVSFLFPAFLIHHGLSHFQQMVFVGSSVAEIRPDPYAAMYCASKHGLKGLIQSVQKEAEQGKGFTDLRLFSPGYMDTDLLPKNAWPRINPPEGEKIHDPGQVAQIFCDFVSDAGQANQNMRMPPFQSFLTPG